MTVERRKKNYILPHPSQLLLSFGSKALSDRRNHLAAILFRHRQGNILSSTKEMENVRKGYETRIQQDLLTDAITGKNRIKLYQQHFQVSLIF